MFRNPFEGARNVHITFLFGFFSQLYQIQQIFVFNSNDKGINNIVHQEYMCYWIAIASGNSRSNSWFLLTNS